MKRLQNEIYVWDELRLLKLSGLFKNKFPYLLSKNTGIDVRLEKPSQN